MAKRSNEPFLWSLFSSGGMIAALMIPILLFLFCFAFPLGWIEAPDYASLSVLVRRPLTRLALFALCSLPLFHGAHRFRFTLVDLGLKSIRSLVAVLCYGAAIVGTVMAFLLVIRVWP